MHNVYRSKEAAGDYVEAPIYVAKCAPANPLGGRSYFPRVHEAG